MKRVYDSPIAEKIEFNYAETVVASNGGGNGDVGHGGGQGGGCDHEDYHGTPKTAHPVFDGCKE